MNKRALRLIAALIIAAAGLYLLIVLLNSMRPVFQTGILLIPGRFLYLSFLEASFYLPLLFLISSFLLFADYYNSRIFIVKLLSLLPFFTLSLLMRVLNYIPGSPAADSVIRTLGVRGGSMVLGLLLIVEFLIITRVLLGRSKKVPTEPVKPRIEEAASLVAEPENEEPEHNFEPVPLKWKDSEDLENMGKYESDAEEDLEEDIIDEDLSGDHIPEVEEISLEEIDSPESDEEEVEDNSGFVEDDFEIEPDFSDEQQIIEPLDLDPEAGSIEHSAETASADAVRPPGDENFPDAPVRGDEEENTNAAREVWADAEQLGFVDELPGNSRIEPVSEPQALPSDDSTDDFKLELETGAAKLEVPELSVEPGSESVDEDLEDLEELEEADSDPGEADPDPQLEPDSVPAKPEIPEPVKSKKKKPVKYSVPVDNLLERYDDDNYWIVDDETREASEVLRETLEEFKIAAEVTGISKGPVITMFEILPAPGVKLSKIVNLADNIALRLAASRVRIVAPIPGKHAVGIEVPNKTRAIVSFKEILDEDNLKKSRMDIPVVLGKDITGGSRIIDLVQTPHLLIAGATGSGKSVCVNSLICSVLYSRTPDEVKMILIDPKIVELKMYNNIPHLLTPVITEPKRAFQALQYAMCEMERRYSLLNALGVRDIKSYNRKVRDGRIATDLLPYIVIIVDEFADLMATTGKELENVISRLAAMSRAIGIHLVLATQRPSVDVITGLIKANIPSRIAFMVASKTDSRIILDSMGADKLLGKGDMLFTSAWDPNPVRIQGAFLSDDEVERVTDHVKTLGEPDYIDDEIFISEDEGGDFELESMGSGDPLMDAAVSIVVEAGKASASYLQRRLKIGYNRAARMVEEMEDRGIVGPANGSKPREIIHIPDRV